MTGVAGTFGGHPAARIFAEDLAGTEDKNLSRRVSRHLTEYNIGLKHIETIHDVTIRRRLSEMWWRAFLQSATGSLKPRLEAQGVSFTLYQNMLRTRFREALRKTQGPTEKKPIT